MRSTLSRFCAPAIIAVAALAPVATADVFVDTSTPGVVFVNGTAGCDNIILGTLCDGSIAAFRFTGLCIDFAIIDAALVPTSVIVIQGGNGADVLDASCVTAAASIEIHGGDGDDTIYGGQGSSFLAGDAGNDYIQGQGGDDAIFGGTGFKDRLYGGAGLDSISDEDGVAVAQGGKGMDFISVNFDAAWDNNANPFDTRKSIGAITGGGDDDTISIVVNGTPIQFGVDGDGATTNPGMFDAVDVTGPIAPGSSFINFEFTDFIP